MLRVAGCYADFTLPSAPSETQTRKINSLYYAVDDPAAPKSHDTGVDVAVGVRGQHHDAQQPDVVLERQRAGDRYQHQFCYYGHC